MRRFSDGDCFAEKRPSFMFNTLLLLCIMVLYPLAGAVLFSLLSGGIEQNASLLHPATAILPPLRLVQSVGQLLMLALPVLVLAAWHTGCKNPFSGKSLSFLGVRNHVDFVALALAVAGIFLLQPLLYTITALQDIYLWPLFGDAGLEVVRQRAVMDAFIKELSLVRSFPEFLSVAFVLAVTPALCEELFFRGYIQQNYARSLSRGGAVLLTGFIFAFFHLSAANLLPLALLGWYIGYLYSKTGNLAIAFAAHLMNNLAALLLLLFADGGDLFIAQHFGILVDSPLWWLVVAVSVVLLVLVLRRFSNPFPADAVGSTRAS